MTIPDPPQSASPDERLIIEDLSAALLAQPLDYVSADHQRHRAVCATLKRFAETGRAELNDADTAASYLANDLRLHHCDEDEDLFPMLTRRAHESDRLDELLAALCDDHKWSEASVESILRLLKEPHRAGWTHYARAERAVILDYATREQRHLAVENGIVMVLARKRLKAADLVAIGSAMKWRRGLTA